MKKSFLIICFLLPLLSLAQLSELEGTWTLDLRPTPDSEGYYQEFKVTEIVEGREFTQPWTGIKK